MINIDVTVEDYDSPDAKTIKLKLPCQLNDSILPMKEYLIIDQSVDIYLDRKDNLYEISEALEKINSANPDLTSRELEAICMASGRCYLTDPDFLNMLAESRFYLEEISKDVYSEKSIEADIAFYMVVEKGIPFKTDITNEEMVGISKAVFSMDEFLDWDGIWEAYASLGFELVDLTVEKELFVYLIYIKY